jgi:hypothetical protein
MVSVQKKLKGTNNVLAAFTIDNGVAIGKKKSGGYLVDAVVFIKGNDDGTATLYINEDKLEELNGNVVYRKFDDEI